MNDARFAILEEFVVLLIEAEQIQHKTRQNNETEVEYIIISTSQPQWGLDTFLIGVIDEKYFAFADFISEFTGIELEMLKFEVQEPFRHPLGVGEIVEPEMSTNSSGVVLQMGTRLQYRLPGVKF
jgi:hypothetical protein